MRLEPPSPKPPPAGDPFVGAYVTSAGAPDARANPIQQEVDVHLRKFENFAGLLAMTPTNTSVSDDATLFEMRSLFRKHLTEIARETIAKISLGERYLQQNSDDFFKGKFRDSDTRITQLMVALAGIDDALCCRGKGDELYGSVVKRKTEIYNRYKSAFKITEIIRDKGEKRDLNLIESVQNREEIAKAREAIVDLLSAENRQEREEMYSPGTSRLKIYRLIYYLGCLADKERRMTEAATAAA